MDTEPPTIEELIAEKKAADIKLAAMRKIGKAFTEGALLAISYVTIIVIVMTGVGNGIRGRFALGMDDSDYDGWHRSGLSVHTDAKTGVQYLSDGKGGMHVRIGTNGLPITK